MVSSLLNLRKRAITSPASPASPPPSPLASSNSARPSRAMSRLSRFGGLSSRRKVDSLSIPTTMVNPAEADDDNDDDDDPFASPVSNRSLGASFRPLKRIRRHSRSFSSAFTALFPPSPSPSAPASGTTTPQPKQFSTSLSPFNTGRPRLTSEKNKKTGGRRGKRDDGIKRRISYPLLSRASCDQPDRVVVRESWGARDETQKAPTPSTLGHLAPLPIPSNYKPCTDQSGSHVVPDWTATTTTIAFVPQAPARASLATSTQAVHHDAHHDDLAGKDSASRFSASTAESIYSTATTDSSAVWVKFPSTMTVTSAAEAPAIDAQFAVFTEDPSADLVFPPSLGFDVQSEMGDCGDAILTAPAPSSSPGIHRDPPPHAAAATMTPKVLPPASAQTSLAWTSKDSSTGSTQHPTPTLKAQRSLPQTRHPHRLLTPPPTPRLLPVHSRLHTPDNLEISPPKYTGLFSNIARTLDAAPEADSTRDSLLSLTLAELSDEMAHIRRRARSTKSSSDSDSEMSSLSPSSLRTSLFPLPKYSHDGPPSFLDLHSHSSQESLTIDPFESLPTTTTTTTPPPPPPPPLPQLRAPQPLQRQHRLLRRISQRLCHTRLPPSPQAFPTTPTRPPREEDGDSRDKSPSLESLLQTPTRPGFAHRLARQSLQFFTR